jgi:N-acetylglutamate synthase-like GNAT family acetyltransferase
MASVFRVGEINRVRKFYRLAGYKGEVGPGDVVIGASRGDDLVGAVRIANEHSVQVLRGMRVKPEFQRQGIGARILEEVRLVLEGRECFAIAYAHLENFYGRIGFRKIDEQEAPAFLRARIETYRTENPQQEFILMRKSS